MYRYTTPTIVLRLPISTDIIEEAYYTLKQDDVIVEKTLESMTKEDNELRVWLSQEDTGKFHFGAVTMQLRIRDVNGNAYASQKQQMPVETVLKEGVI